MSKKTKELYKCPHCHQEMTLSKLKEHKISCPFAEARKNKKKFAKKRPIVRKTENKNKNRTSVKMETPKRKRNTTRRFTSKIH